MKSVRRGAVRRRIVLAVCAGASILLPGASVWLTATSTTPQHASTTTIISAGPNPSVVTEPLAVFYTVTPSNLAVYSTGMPAGVVVGQPNFTSGSINQGGPASANTLRSPAQTLVVNGKLLIADSQNNRVLIFNSIPTTDNASANVVIGQTSVSGVLENQGGTAGPKTLDRPSGLATDGRKLFVLDRDNHRVLIYNNIPTTSNAAADVVIGHSTMTDSSWCGEGDLGDTTGVAANCLSSGPTGLLYDAVSGKLVVYDSDNNRVLIYNSVPATNGASADVVIGQADFTHNLPNRGGAAAADTLDLSTASGLGSFGGKLLIADRMNNRVLVYNTFPTVNGAPADLVIGQTNFTDTSANGGGVVSASGLDQPRGAQVDPQGRLFIPEANNSRVLVFNSIPTSSGASADVVIGQPDFADNTARTTQNGLATFPYHVSFFPGHFVLTDQGNQRVLIFAEDPALSSLPVDGPGPTGTVTVRAIGGSETCTGTVAETKCWLTPTTVGGRIFIATYNGDAITAPSVSAPIAHTVSSCTLDPVVVNTNPSGAGSLEDAVGIACAGSTVTFAIPGPGPHTIGLAGVTLIITKDLTIRGSSDGVGISGQHLAGIFLIDATSHIVLDGLTLVDGSSSFGAAVTSFGTVTIRNSTLSGNTVPFAGGAVVNGGVMTIENSTISGNSATNGGGAIDTSAGTSLTLTHVTITGNTITASDAVGGGLITGPHTTIANSIIAGNTSPGGDNVSTLFSGPFSSSGRNVLSGDPMLGPLQDNGGRTWTHAPLPGSPALDAGDNTVATNAGLTTDQRGFARVRDAADLGLVQTVDVGAVEADPMVQVVGDQTIEQGASFRFTLNVGDETTTPLGSFTVTSGNTALLPNTAGHVDVTGGGGSRTITLTPVTHGFGTSIVTLTAARTLGGAPRTSTASFTLRVNASHVPTLDPIAALSIPEDSPQRTVNLTGISAGTGGTPAVTVTAVSGNPALIPNPTVTYASPNPTGSLAFTPVPNLSGMAAITVTVSNGVDQTVRTFTVTVTPVGDTPLVEPNPVHVLEGATAFVQLRRSPDDGNDTYVYFKITNIAGGTMQSGEGPTHDGDFIFEPFGLLGAFFTPPANSTATGHFTVQASASTIQSPSDAGLGGAPVVVDVIVDSVPDEPTITPAATTEDMQTASGLVITRNVVDGPDVTHFKILGIQHGSLFQHDGVTPIHAFDVITAAQGAAGLRFTPAPDFSGSASFTAIGVLDASGFVNGAPAAATGVITVTAVADTPSITNAMTTINTQTAAGLVVTRNPGDGDEVGFVKVTGITGGSLFQHDGMTPIANGAFITMAQASAGLRFTPITDSVETGHITIQAAKTATDADLGGAAVTADIVVIRFVGRVATGADAGGGPHVRRFNALDGTPPSTGALNSFFAFDAFFGGVRVASGDVNGDGVADVIAGAGPGGLPEIRIFDGASGAMIASYLAFESSFRGGVFVAAGDVDGDGIVDVIAGSGAGRAAEVKVFHAGSPIVIRDQFVFDGFTGGVHVGAGDVNGDGRADLIVGSGPGIQSEVRVLHSDNGATLRTIHPYGAFVGGVFVAAGDVNGDGYADIVTGSDAGGGPHVQVFDGVTGAGLMSFYAFDPSFSGGVRVAAGDVTGDGRADVIVGSGPGMPATFRVFDGASATMLSEVPAYGPFMAGLFVATEAPVNRMYVDLPAPGATVHGPFTLGGWALVDNATSAGIAAIHVWAVPAGGGTPMFVGLATLGDERPDVAAFFGAQYAHAGFHLEAALPPGTYDLAVAAQSIVPGTFQMMRIVRITVTP